ncbi:phosphate ABC transporter substrate-binding protein (PhoT family) [Flavimobilis soli]|uniref:Phosphate-binding protein n=1 Tax=Flavimobilis soli TaxID=442709 RepID=A0A2A9EEK5_9MICO|nr:phosphate ABC transporter substrate-binding protein PstS [Flavimobilis soli]PFG37338.1 phosphate ABC transporter substrate-binding protein (PhoT family) [Flavimobilis soli]
MTLSRTTRAGAALAVGALTLALAACGGSDAPTSSGGATTSGDSAATDELSGILAGAGASSQGKAMEGWIAGFGDIAPNVALSYDPAGSGAGREQFLAGSVQLAGSDAALKPEELTAATERCYGGEALELPLYISPIAVIYNLPDLGTEHLQLSAETIAKIFNGDITTWNDPAIAAENDGVTLPDLAITPVSRSDESGTTENFVEYLAAAGDGAWPHEVSGDWPVEGGQSAQGTSGVVDTVAAAEGTIGYADASRAGDLGTVAIKVGDEYVPFSAEAAAKVVDASPRAEDATDKRLVVELDRTTTEPGAYPLVLISYSVACSVYEDPADAANVKAFLTYVASPDGQERAADPAVAGSAPISDALRTEAQAAIDAIAAK